MERSDWLLAFLAAGDGKEFSHAQICKGLFLVSKNLPDLPENFYEFYPGDYGPSCLFDALTQDLLLLQKRGDVHLFQANPSQYCGRYACSIQGYRRSGQNWEISQKHQKYLKKIGEWILPLSFSRMIGAISRAFPEMFEKAAFR